MPAKSRILIVDDVPESVWALIEFLESDYEVLYATTAEKALTLAFSANRPDLILLDIKMPDMDGYEFLSKLKAEDYTREIPVVFVTALSEAQDEVKGLDSGAQDYIIKPIRPPVVAARVKSILALKKELDRRLLLKTQLEEISQRLEGQIKTKMMELDEAKAALHSYEEKFDTLFQTRPYASQSRKVLVVDDEPENIHLFSQALEDDYQVLYAISGIKALEIANSDNRPDVVLLDVVMPEMDGFEVCSRLKADAGTWDIPVIFVTARDDEIDEAKGLNLGAADFISKPVSMPVAKARIKAALRFEDELDKRVVLTRNLEDLNKNLEKRVQEKTIALRRAHDELSTSEEKYRTIYETAIEGIFETTPEGRFLSASPSLARIMGYASPQEMVATIHDAARQQYVNPADRERFTAQLEKDGEIFNFETQFKKKQGDIIWVMMCARVVRNTVNDLIHYQGFLIDITQQKRSQLKNLQHLRELRLLNKVIAASVTGIRAEDILETACKELSQAFNLSQAMALLIDSDRTSATVAAEHLPDASRTAVTGKCLLNKSFSFKDHPSAAQLFTPTSPVVIRDVRNDETLRSIVGSLEGWNIRSLLLAPLVVKDKTIGCLGAGSQASDFFSEEKVGLVQSVADQISGALARIQLDEDRHQLEKQYYQAQKMEAIGQLTGGVAHDFNNILTVIIGTIGLLRQEVGLGSPAKARLDQMEQSAMRAADLVRQLLAFGRQQFLQPVPLDFNSVLRQFGKMLKRIIGEDIEMVTHLEPDLDLVKADQGQMEQVLMNLVVNARDAMPHGGCLTIETANANLDDRYASQHLDVEPGAYVMVAVSDTGIGIEKSKVLHVFEPFFTTKPKGEGTGLGLSTVHGIIKQSNGHIWVYSEPGQGTCFRIYLPRFEGEGAVDREKEVATEAVGGSETILVVEDDEALRNMVCSTLSGFGYAILTADRASSAWVVFAAHEGPVDLVLTDVVLPGEENGVDLAKRLSEKRAGLKVLFMSGYLNRAIMKNGILDKGAPFIQKPFVREDLARKVRQVLDD